MSGLIYEDCGGVLRSFLKAVIKDAVAYTLYCERKTITPIDLVFALKQHGCNIYGFTSPWVLFNSSFNSSYRTDNVIKLAQSS